MNVDWQSFFWPSVGYLDLILRGSAVFLGLFALLRILVRRHVGTLSLMDLLLIVLIADAAQNAMASEYRSVPEGLVLCATLIAWSYFFDWLAYRFPVMQRILEPSPLLIIRDGELQRRNMRQEYISKEEVMSHLREHGVESVREVRRAFMEPDGQLSILKFDSGQGDDDQPTKKHGGAQ
jgi:uncharacterized membrane protein YcaP (DUF421 family)